LAEPASELGLEISSAMGITRDTGAGIFDNAALRDAAFSDEVLGARHNSEVIELAGETFVTLRVKAHHEPSVRPLEEVRADIVAAITDEAARAAVAREARDIIALMESGNAIDDIASDRGYEWQVELGASRQAFAVSAPVLQRVFELAPPTAGPVSDYILTEDGNAVVVQLIQVTPGKYDAMPGPEQQQLQRQVLGEVGGLVDSEFQQSLQRDADIVVM
ncbi:MAG: hypothetical protein R3228_07460, partial [Halioglobus sp.]|nr:hypothetical protein [Halioglobus sp.]